MSLLFFGTPARVIFTLAVLVFAIHVAYFLILPHLLSRHATHDPRIRRRLERIVATPSLLGDGMRIAARHDLMRLALSEGRHEQAAAQGFAILSHSPSAPGLTAEVRGRLADALEALGRGEEARQQRHLAEADLEKAPQDPAWFVNRGRQLDSRQEYASACRVYEAGLKATRPDQNGARAILTLHLSNSLFMAGRPLDSAQRAEEVIELVHVPEQTITAHRQASASYAEAGLLDEAEAHRRSAVAVAERLGDVDQLANALAELADMHRKRGRLVEALTSCDQATNATRPARQTELVRFETYRSWGRFHEALAALDRVVQLDPLPIPRNERMLQGLFAYVRAGVFMDQDRLDEAQRALNDARAGLHGDPKLVLWRDAAAIRLAAFQGRKDLTLADLKRLESQLNEYSQDKNTMATVLGNLGRAALALGESSHALDVWRRFLELKPNPVDVPTGHYYLGEAHRGLGDNLAARASYREAVATQLDTYHAQLAQTRLRTVLG